MRRQVGVEHASHGRKAVWGSPTTRGLMVLALTVAVVGLAPASAAVANLKQEFAPFADCPLTTPGVGTCIVSTTTSGEFVLGNKTVPITKTITLQGGLIGEGPTCCDLAPAADGDTLSKTPLPVPGGLVGIALPGNFSEVNATAELAGSVHINPNAVLGQLGVAVSLPLKVKLENPLLGNECYVGTDSSPVPLQLTTGKTAPPLPNTAITGAGGHLHLSAENQIFTISGVTLVDNAFAAPGASGCGPLPPAVDAAVDLETGLPAAAGHNTAILNSSVQEASVSSVAAVLPLPDVGKCEPAEGTAEGRKTVFHGLYTDAGCVKENETHNGKFEWKEGPGAKKALTGASGPVTLESVGKTRISCTAGASQGELTGAKTQTVTFTLTGCASGVKKSSAASCQSAGSGQGEIKTTQLAGELEFINEMNPLKPVVGLDLKPASPGGNIAAFECGGTPSVIGGSVIASVTPIDKMGTTFKLKASSKAGLQTPEEFEGGPKDTLTLATSGGTPEQAGLTATDTFSTEEPLEIKGAI